MRNFDKEIQQKTSEAEDLIRKVKREIAAIAEEGRTTAYWGEYGENGQTYYSKGYIEDNKGNYIVDWLFSDYQYQPGSWISSSEMC